MSRAIRSRSASGSSCKSSLLPFAALLIAVFLKLSPDLALGLMLVAAAPGGATANIYSHLAKGDVALNITLTAVNSLLALHHASDRDQSSARIFLRRRPIRTAAASQDHRGRGDHSGAGRASACWSARAPRISRKRMEKPIKLFSILVLAVLIAARSISNARSRSTASSRSVSPASPSTWSSMLTGYLAPLALKLPERQAIAITMEIGIHNTALAIYVALNVLNNPAASLVPGIYTLCMYLTATLFALYITRRATAPAAA